MFEYCTICARGGQDAIMIPSTVYGFQGCFMFEFGVWSGGPKQGIVLH